MEPTNAKFWHELEIEKIDSTTGFAAYAPGTQQPCNAWTVRIGGDWYDVWTAPAAHNCGTGPAAVATMGATLNNAEIVRIIKI